MQFYKKILCAGYLLPTFKKFSRQGLFSAKKIKTKGSFIAGLKHFFLLLLEIETEELVGKKQSSTTRALCDNNRNMLCFYVIHKIEQLQYYNRNFKTCCRSRMGKSVMHGDQTSFSFSRCVVLKEKAHPFFINLIDSCLILFCLLFTAKNVYN